MMSNVGMERLRAMEIRDRQPKPEIKMPAVLIAWGCDEELWQKVRSKQALVRLAEEGNEAAARERIRMLRNSPSVSGQGVALTPELAALGVDEEMWQGVRSKSTLIRLATEDEGVARARIAVLRKAIAAEQASVTSPATPPTAPLRPTRNEGSARPLSDGYAIDGELPAGVDVNAVTTLVARRVEAKAQKDYEAADALQAELLALGLMVNDRSRRVFDVARVKARAPKGRASRQQLVYTLDGALPAGTDEAAVTKLVERRAEAKLKRDFAAADALQHEILSLGVGVNDKTLTFFAGGQGAKKEADRRA